MKLSCFVLGLFVFTLVSCGGGGGGGSDGGSSDGGSSSSSSSSESSQGLNIPTSDLTINGLVTDGLANADVIVTIRNLTFKTKTDSSGHYSVTLAIDESHLSDLVLITAQGSGTQAKVKLTSLLLSANTLISQAGSDKILDVTENFGVNVTSVSTAQYALSTSASGFGVSQIIPVSEIELINRLQWVNIKSQFELAAIIRLVAESKYGLAAGIPSTLELALSADSTRVLKQSVSLEDSTILDKTIAEIKADQNVVVNNNESLVGSFILNSGSRITKGIITFNADLTGELALAANEKKINFSWVQTDNTVDISFDEPLPDINSGQYGAKVINSAWMAIQEQFVGPKRIYWREFKTEIDGGSVSWDSFDATLTDISKTLKPEQNKLSGLWLNSGFNNSIRFNDDGSVSYGRLGEEPKVYSWSIDSNKLIISDSGTEVVGFYLTGDLGVGYSYVAISHGVSDVNIDEGLLIKPQENLILKKSDLVGVWTDADVILKALYSDNLVVENLGSWARPWSYIDGEKAWEESAYDQDFMIYGAVCNLASKSPCVKRLTNSHKIIARMDNLYYTLNKRISYDHDGLYMGTGYTLTQSYKLPEIQFFGNWIIGNSKKIFYQQTSNGIKVWSFNSNEFTVGDKSIDMLDWSQRNNFSIFNGKLRYARDSVNRELELLSVSNTGLTVCEYNEASKCIKGTDFFLGNRVPVKISLNAVGSGSIQNINSNPFEQFNFFGNVANYSIVPDTGYKVQSVTGCGGTLSDYNNYTTSEIRESCTVTATFVKN